MAAASAAPLATFDFDLRGANPAEQIHSLDEIGFSGIAMWMNSPADLAKFEAYQAAVPETRLVAGLVIRDPTKPLKQKHLENVVRKLATMDDKLWLIVGGKRTTATTSFP